MAYYKLTTPTDLLTVNYFLSSGLWKGRFVQEKSAPWGLWLEDLTQQSLLGIIQLGISDYAPAAGKIFTAGTPSGEVAEMAWTEIFKRSVIARDEVKRVGGEVVALMRNEETLYELVKNHFMLMQGDIQVAVLEGKTNFYLAKIKDPSLWVFNQLLSDSVVWYNKLGKNSGVYLEAGWKMRGIGEKKSFNQFITKKGIVLIQRDGKLALMKPEWKNGEDSIEVAFNGAAVSKRELNAKIKVKPFLRKTDTRSLTVFWKTKDTERFRRIASSESLKTFDGYKAWFSKDGMLYISADRRDADRALASILTDAFEAYYEFEPSVMVPAGLILAPRLSSERLHAILNAPVTDVLCLEPSEGGINCTILPFNDGMKIENFISIETEQAAKRVESVSQNWKFDFSDLKKKKADH